MNIYYEDLKYNKKQRFDKNNYLLFQKVYLSSKFLDYVKQRHSLMEPKLNMGRW